MIYRDISNMISAVVFLSELLITLWFYQKMFKPRIKVHFIALVAYLLYFQRFVVFAIRESVFIDLGMFCVISFIVLMFYKCNIKTALSNTLCMLILKLSSQCIAVVSISSIIFNDIQSYYASDMRVYALNVLASQILFFVFLLTSTKLNFNYGKKTKFGVSSYLFIVPNSLIVVLFAFYNYTSALGSIPLTDTITSIASVVMIFVIIISIMLTYVYYGKSLKELDELYKLKSEKSRVASDTAYYSILDRQNEMLKSFIHDEKNHLSTIKSLADSPEVSEYIDKIYGEIKHHSMFGNTKNKMLDLVINKYNYICEKESIDFYVTAKTSNLLYIDNPDLITLLGNLLDNAVEAAKLSTEKKIDFFVNKVNGFDVLTCSNSCDDKPVISGSVLKSTKSDTGEHGLGIKSIRRIVKKYDGEFEWQYDNSSKEFVAHIIFKPNA